MDNRSIFLSRLATFDDGVTQKDKRSTGWKWWLTSVSRIPQENPRGHSTVRLGTWPYGRQVSDFTLPGKTSKESSRCPYHKPTQVDEVNIHRRSRERSLRN
jgi:hypothetical protein